MDEFATLKYALLTALHDEELGIPEEVFDSTLQLREWLTSELAAEADQEARTLDD